MAGISSLTGTISTEFKYTAQNNRVGAGYNPIGVSDDVRKNYNLGTGAANGASGGADEVFSFQQALIGGATASVDLFNLTNVLAQTSIALVRIKGYQVRLLSVADDSTITSPVASSVTITNNGNFSVPSQLDFGTGGSGLTLALTTSAGAISSVSIGAAGSGYPPSSTFNVSPVQAAGFNGVVAATTNSSGVVTAITLLAGGSGYSNATVPTVVLGQYTVYSGGAHMYFDVQAGGFLPVSSSARNVKIVNNDPVNIATVEITVFGATT